MQLRFVLVAMIFVAACNRGDNTPLRTADGSVLSSSGGEVELSDGSRLQFVITSERQGCRLMHQRLLAWYRDPRVTLAVQYTFREDDLFPTGLVTTDLSRARPALREWQAWGQREGPDAPPPPKSTCGS